MELGKVIHTSTNRVERFFSPNKSYVDHINIPICHFLSLCKVSSSGTAVTRNGFLACLYVKKAQGNNYYLCYVKDSLSFKWLKKASKMFYWGRKRNVSSQLIKCCKQSFRTNVARL